MIFSNGSLFGREGQLASLTQGRRPGGRTVPGPRTRRERCPTIRATCRRRPVPAATRSLRECFAPTTGHHRQNTRTATLPPPGMGEWDSKAPPELGGPLAVSLCLTNATRRGVDPGPYRGTPNLCCAACLLTPSTRPTSAHEYPYSDRAARTARPSSPWTSSDSSTRQDRDSTSRAARAPTARTIRPAAAATSGVSRARRPVTPPTAGSRRRPCTPTHRQAQPASATPRPPRSSGTRYPGRPRAAPWL